MAVKCVNINHAAFKALADKIGFAMAKSVTVANDYAIPTVDEATAIIRGTKIKQFKNAVVHMRNLKNPTIDELFKGFNGIVRKYGDSWYVVNGSRISDVPAPLAVSEIEQPNIKFLEALNETFGNIFKLSGVSGSVTGIRLITGSEPIVAGQSLPTRAVFSDEAAPMGIGDDVATFRSGNQTMGSSYLRNAQWFAEGFIPGPKSMQNNVKLPYANKSVARKIADLRDAFNAITSTSREAKAEKEKIKNRMFEIADKAFNGFKESLKTNIRSLFDKWDSKLINRSRHWYDGANRIAQNLSATYGVSLEATAGIMASLSPQNEWFNNISAADRVMDIMKNHLTVPVSSAMYDTAAKLSVGEPFEMVVRAIKEQYADRSLGEILTLADNDKANEKLYQDIASNVLRVVDLSVHGPEVNVVSPEGVASGIKIDTGGLTRFAWGSSNEIFKAIDIFRNPSIDNISSKIGMGLKVRNFYNNISNPNSETGEVTVDTHAMAAAFLNVINADEASAMNLFRSGGSPIYAIIKEAYQDIATEKGLKPREVQSIAWEAVRLMIKESDKTETNRNFINNIWKDVQNKKITHEQAIEQIFGKFGFDRPQWDRAAVQNRNAAAVRSSEIALQQADDNGSDIRGQQPAAGEGDAGVVNRSEVTPGKGLFTTPSEDTRVIAEEYKKANNLNVPEGAKIYSLDIDLSKRIADAFDAMENNPTDPIVKTAYEQMAQQTMDQFYVIQKAGYVVELYNGKGEPYKNSQEMIADVRDNKHQYVLSTEKDFGSTPITDQLREENPLLRDSGETDINGNKLLINDVFRYVHDFFGHTARGNSFGPIGEENAWDEHARMYTGLARRAMTTETRGQNSWVNFGPHMRNANGSIKQKGDEGYKSATERPFADQKSGLLPEEFSMLPEEKGEERKGVRPDTNNVKVEVDEQVLSDMTQENQDEAIPIDNDNIGWKPFDTDTQFQKVNEAQLAREQQKRFALDNITRMLKLKFGIKVNVVNDPGSYWRGKYSKGVITINEAYVTADTAFHEVMHPFIDILKKENPELYNSLMTELKESERGKIAFEYTQRQYPELSEDDQWDETLVEQLGIMSSEQYLEKDGTKTLFSKFVDWIKTVLAKMGIGTDTFKTNMSLEDFSKLIVNPSFVFDLAHKIDYENHAERYSKLSNNFDEVINRVRQKLHADSASKTKNMSEDTSKRKYFSGKTAEALTADPKDLKAIDNFILSSAMNLKKLNEKFEDFKTKFDAKPVKSAADLGELSKLLNEIEDCVTLYEDVDLLISAVMDEFPDAEDSIGNLKKNYNKEAALINNYKSYAKELVVNWLFPHGKAAINKALATGKPFTIVSKSMYEAVQKELQSQNITDKRQILETAFKRELSSYLTIAKKDASAVTQFLGPLLHSRDPLSALIARAVVEEYTGALKKGLHIQERLVKLVRQARGVEFFNTNKDHFDFYSKYMRQAISYEYAGVDDKGEHTYKEVKRWAFHEEYNWDQFYKAKREMEKTLGPAPSKNDTAKWNAFKTKQDAWYAAHTVKTIVGGKDARIPSPSYKNATFAALQGDKLFKELYGAYKDANNRVGKGGLKYGIIPQARTVNLKTEKGKVAQTAIEKLRLFIGEDDQVYFNQKNNLKEQKSVPIGFTRLLDENDLSFDLLNSVAKYAVSSEKYNSISNIEPHVNILKNFIGGNASLGIDARQVVKTSASGLKALSKAERKAMQVEATRINAQLDSFLNDVIYGQPMKKASIQMFNSKFKVVDKNGNEETMKGFDNLTEHIGIPGLDYSGFEVGTERQLKDWKVTMLRKDWNWSVKKGANTLGLITAFQQLALNPVAGVINVLRAKLETFIEGAGGRYFNIGDALKAEGIYFRALGSGDFFEDLKGGKQSFLSEMLIEYDGIQGELYNELGAKIPGSLANRLFRRNHLFLMQQGGEHYVQSQLMIAMMLHQKVKLNSGDEISLYEAKKREYAGTLKMSDTNWTEDHDADFRQGVKFVNTNMHGNYNKLDKAYLQRTWWGSLLMMFRKHIYTGFASRYRSGYVNHQTGNYTEGYYRTFFNGLVNQVRSLVEQKRMGQMTDDEKYAFRKIAADFAGLALLFVGFKAFDDDDDDEEFNDYMALISRRLISEGVQYTPVIGTMDLAKVVTNPSASVSTIDKVWDAVSQSISDPTAEYERSGAGYQVGQNKAAVKWGRALPLYRQYINTVEPERLLQFYGKNSIWFLKPKTGKNGTDDE